MKPAFGGRLAGTEALRGLACLLLVYYHVYLYTAPHGAPSRGTIYTAFISRWQLGLSFFFVLSGFLLYRPFVQAILEQRPRPAFRAYLRNRVLRIVPAYWAILVLAAVFGVTVVWIPHHDFAFHLPTFVADLFFVQGLFPSGSQTGIPPAWTLGVEWGFYLALPLLVLLAGRLALRARSHRGRILAVLAPPAVLLALGLAGQYLGHRTVVVRDPYGFQDTWHAVAERSFPAWASMFAFGTALAVLRVEREAGRLRLPGGWRAGLLAIAVAGAAGIAWLQQTARLDIHPYNVLMGIPLTALLAAVVLSTRSPAEDRFLRVLEWRPLVFAGNVTLSAYLLHYPVIVYLIGKGIYRDGWGGMLFNALVVSAVLFPLSYASHRWIERPFMRLKSRRQAPAPRGASVTMAQDEPTREPA